MTIWMLGILLIIRNFGKHLNQCLSDKAKCGSSRINLVENDEILSTDKEIAEAFNILAMLSNP